MLNGKVKVMLITMCSIKSVQSSDDTQERTYLGDIIRAVLSWDPCLRGLSGWLLELSSGVAGDRERVGPCSVFSRMLNQGLWLVLAP